MNLTLVVSLSMTVLAVIYLVRYRSHSADIYCAPAAWLRAGIYFCFCLLLAIHSGALEATLTSPVIWPGQLQDVWWWLGTAVVTVFIVVAYWGYWYRHTIRFDRKLHVLPQLVMGFCWGVTSGLLFLSFWHFALAVVGQGSPWLVWLLAYVMISVWQALWMDMYWDVYISPEHDSPQSIRKKVPRTHIPNMTLCLAWFAIYQNYALFISLQTIALLAASFGMRFPPPWGGEATLPARRVPGLLGLPRAGGYISKNPAKDPYLKAARLDG
jgi:hypothetical protein